MSNRLIQRRFQSVEMEPVEEINNYASNPAWIQENLRQMQLKRSEMNELIMDYLVREGFKEAAERFREEAGIEMINLRLRENINNMASRSIYSANHKAESSCGGGRSNSNSILNNGEFNHNNTNSSLTTSKNATNTESRNNNNNNNRNNQVVDMDYQDLVDSPNDKVCSQNYRFEDEILDEKQSRIETSEMMDKRIKIKQLIENGEILDAQSLINQYYPELLDSYRNLYFTLQQQHLIELIRQQKISDVLTYVHDHLSLEEFKDLNEMEKTLALLAYEKPDKSPYANLLRDSRRFQLASEINEIIIQETIGDVESSKPRLVTLIKLLLWTQSELERKKIQFPKMTDLVNGTILEPVSK